MYRPLSVSVSFSDRPVVSVQMLASLLQKYLLIKCVWEDVHQNSDRKDMKSGKFGKGSMLVKWYTGQILAS